jgi:multiple sugar transport system ATP-binding protein
MNLLKGHYRDGMIHLPGDNRYSVPDQGRAMLHQGLRGEEVIIGFRPEAARITTAGGVRTQVYADALHGAYSMLHLSLDGERGEAMAHVRAERDANHPIGAPVRFDLDPTMVRFFDPQTEQAVKG